MENTNSQVLSRVQLICRLTRVCHWLCSSVALGHLQHLQLRARFHPRLGGSAPDGPAAQCGREPFPEHPAQEHVDERIQAHISGRQPQRGLLGDRERVLCPAGSDHVSDLHQGVRDPDEVKGGKADGKNCHHDEDLGFGAAFGSVTPAL